MLQEVACFDAGEPLSSGTPEKIRPSLPDLTAQRADPEPALDDLATRVAAAFRRHPHINNVLTHISGANWSRVAQALKSILNPRAESRELSPLACNLLDLMCADRGVTGRILKPYYRDQLSAMVGPDGADRCIAHITRLFTAREAAAREAAQAHDNSSSSNHVGEPEQDGSKPSGSKQ